MKLSRGGRRERKNFLDEGKKVLDILFFHAIIK